MSDNVGAERVEDLVAFVERPDGSLVVVPWQGSCPTCHARTHTSETGAVTVDHVPGCPELDRLR